MNFFKNSEKNVFAVTLLCMLIMLVLISILTTVILFAAKLADDKSVPVDADVQTTVKNENTSKEPPITTPPVTTQGTQTPPPTTTTQVSQTTPPTTTTQNTTTVPDPEPKKKVAVTFDDGPNSSMTYKFVDKLKEYGATATFFVVGNRMGQNNGAALKYALDNGCEVGLHSYSHSYYNKMTLDEYLKDLEDAEKAVKKYVQADIRLMRPPGGILSTEQKEANPYTAIMWSVDSNDWQYSSIADGKKDANVQAIVDNVMSVVREGDIVLMHELYENSYEAFCIIIEQLYDQGYEIVTVSELLGEDKIVPGEKYYSGR